MSAELDPDAIAHRDFDVARRGYDQHAVRGYLHRLAGGVGALQRELAELRARVEASEALAARAAEPDEGFLLAQLGEETTRVLASARESAAEIRAKAEESAGRLIAEAQAQASAARNEAEQHAARLRAGAEADAARLLAEASSQAEALLSDAREEAARVGTEAQQLAEALVEEAREQGREMVAEAQAVRERILRDMAARRRKAREQVEKLNAGRERLLAAYAAVRATLDEATAELTAVLGEARVAGDAAARRAAAEPDPTVEELEAEVAAARLVDLNLGIGEPEAALPGHLAELDHDPTRGPLSGEVPAFVAETGSSEPGVEPALVAVEPPDEVEGVRVLTEPSQGEPEPAEPVTGTDPVPETLPTPTPAPAPAASEVDDLFARLRAGQQPGHAPTSETTQGQDGDRAAIVVRDEAVAGIERDLTRVLKRLLADEQNEVLDLLRRTTPGAADEVLPPPAEHAGRWVDAARGPLALAAAAGARSVAPEVLDAVDPAGVPAELAEHMTAPLRDRIQRCFEQTDGDLDEVTERVRALYREWKGQRLTDAVRHHVLAAHAVGVSWALPAGCPVRWVLDPAAEPCPDAEDNALAGVLCHGDAFPTGHARPPAHPGCRCLIVRA